MNNPNAIYQHGVPLLPPPPPLPSQQQQPQPQQKLQQQNASRLSQQQQQYPTHYPAGSPHQPQNISASRTQFLPSQSSNQTPQHPQYASQPSNLLHQPADPGFYPQPSPYNTQTAPGNYSSTDPNEVMAQAAMSRQPQPFPPILGTPQSQSPASMHSPHYDATGRASYAGYPSMAQPMYFGQAYGMQAASAYPQPPPPPPPPSVPVSQGYSAVSSSAYSQQPAVSQGYPTAPSSSYAQQSPVSQNYPTPSSSGYSQQPSAPQNYPAVTTSYQQHAAHHVHHQAYPPQPQQVPSQPQDQKPSAAQLQRSSYGQPPPQIQPQQVPTQQPHHAHHQQQQQQPHHHQTTPQTPQPAVMPSVGLQQPTASTASSGSANNAAPGPIPATTPLVVRQDHNGVQWIMFEYSRDRVKLEYTIRCDVESVKVEELSQEFKSQNCVYPRACMPKDNYKGNRFSYETECNAVGWALAELNPPLREKRGLIQRAVDSWRNSNRDPRLRSRRVRRQAKMNTRKNNLSSAIASSSVQAPQTLQPPRPGTTQHHLHALHHHHHGEDPRTVDGMYHPM